MDEHEAEARTRAGFDQMMKRKRAHNTFTANDDVFLSDNPEASSLGMYLLETWAWGEISALHLQKTRAMAINDGVTNPAAKKLASMGANG